MKRILLLSIAAFALLAAMATKQTPRSTDVVMTVGNVPVTAGEFEYLYKKNQSQADSMMSVDDYAQLFADFKRKVLEAKACGLDTVAAYRADMARYAREHALPYVWDDAMADSLMRVAYSHVKENVEVSHIMITPLPDRNEHQCAVLADSLLALLVSGADFTALAEQYSAQPGNGYLGFLSAGSTPYSFESVAFATAPGEFAKVVTPYGHHIIKVHSRRSDPGSVKVRHLLRLTRGLDDEQTAAVKVLIDSLYDVAIASPDQFAALADAYTEDPSGQGKGGDLDWFGAGRMVPEFEQTSFALADGEISKPVRTSYGYHIIKREGWRPTPVYDEMKPELEQMIRSDERLSEVRLRAVRNMRGAAGVKIDKKVLKRVNKQLGNAGAVNQQLLGALGTDSSAVAIVAGKPISVAEVASALVQGAENATATFDGALDNIINTRVSDWMLATLGEREPQYAHLIQEYADGMLLYEICQKMVWGAPQSDPEGLEAFFRANADKYQWDKPRYRGMVILAVTDSVADAAVEFLTTLPDTLTAAECSTELRKVFRNDAKIERVLAAQGDNAVIEYIAFGGPMPDKGSTRWSAFRAFRGEIIDKPTCATDVRSRVSVDYQAYLEKQFADYLRAKYPVVINYEVLHSLQ